MGWVRIWISGVCVQVQVWLQCCCSVAQLGLKEENLGLKTASEWRDSLKLHSRGSPKQVCGFFKFFSEEFQDQQKFLWQICLISQLALNAASWTAGRWGKWAQGLAAKAFVLVYSQVLACSKWAQFKGCWIHCHYFLSDVLSGVLSGVALLKELLGYRRGLREEGKPDYAVRKGSKKHMSNSKLWKVHIACFQLLLSVNVPCCHRVLWHSEIWAYWWGRRQNYILICSGKPVLRPHALWAWKTNAVPKKGASVLLFGEESVLANEDWNKWAVV